jgi:hypothetical protein
MSPRTGKMSDPTERQKVPERPNGAIDVAEARIAWVLDHPHTSEWLKNAIRTADGLEPAALQNDVEVLKHLVQLLAHAHMEISLRSLRGR